MTSCLTIFKKLLFSLLRAEWSRNLTAETLISRNSLISLCECSPM